MNNIFSKLSILFILIIFYFGGPALSAVVVSRGSYRRKLGIGLVSPARFEVNLVCRIAPVPLNTLGKDTNLVGYVPVLPTGNTSRLHSAAAFFK